MTNVYFKKENDIILNGTLWKEVENRFMLCTSLANHQKHSAPPVGAGAGAYHPPHPSPVSSPSSSASSARLPQLSTGVPPAGYLL